MERIIKVLNEINPTVNWEKETDLIGNRILDSLKIVQLVGALNDEFDIEITPMDVVPENFRTAEDIARLVSRLEDE